MPIIGISWFMIEGGEMYNTSWIDLTEFCARVLQVLLVTVALLPFLSPDSDDSGKDTNGLWQ